MLKITPYLGIFVLIVSIAGLWFPILGYFLLLVFATLMLTSIVRGRWFCGNLCPRGSFNDFWISRISRNKKIPKVFRSFWLRIPILVLMMSFMVTRLMATQGLVDRIGMVFVMMCLITTSIAIIVGVFYSPRAWCTFCPMGTMQNMIGGQKHKLSLDASRCIECNKCEKQCPMQLEVHKGGHKSDCIRCGRCISACPTKALSFKA